MKKLRLLSLCSGIGGADLAAEWTGAIEVVGQVEIDTFCQSVLSKHWPHVARMSDIKNVQGDEFGRIDLVAGGIPCQPFSSAGKQHGADDDRYLWPEMFRIVQRCHPAWVVIENVDDFTYMALDVVQADLENQDYAVQAFVLPACAVGAPHIRERCFVVAYSNRLGESRQKSAISDGQRSTIESTSIRQRTNTTNMADSTCSRETTAQQPRQRCSPEQSSEDMAHSNIGQCARSTQFQARREQISGGRDLWPDIDRCGEDVAHAQYRRCQRGIEHKEQSSATLLCSGSATWSESQSRMGRMFDGISAKLDGIRWPSGPGQEQQEWEPARTVTGRQPYRNRRLKALGNTIVPYQIFPIFQGIVVWETGKEEISCNHALP